MNPVLVELVNKISAEQPELLKGLSVVGDWLWLEFDSIPAVETREYLKFVGFRFNRKRKLWQNACGVKSRSTDGDPTITYGKFSIARIKEEA